MTASSGGPPAVRAEGAGIEGQVEINGFANEMWNLRNSSTPVAATEATSVRSQLEGRPRVDVLFFYTWALGCGDDFSMRRDCASEVIEFYRAHRGHAPVLIGRLESSSSDDAVWLPGDLALRFLERHGIPTRIEAASITTEAQAGWVVAAALLGLAMAAALAALARHRGGLEPARVGTNGP